MDPAPTPPGFKPVPALLFLDRDGTLMADTGYPRNPAGVTLLPGAADAVRELAGWGFVPAVVSNQSGVGRGLITPAEADAVHARFVSLFAAASGLTLPAWYCPHAPDAGCACRKPRPGLLTRAAAELGLTGSPGVVVGDKPSDLAAGAAAGYAGLLLSPPEFGWPAVVAALAAARRDFGL